jgi:hypothetical protein
MDDIRNLPRPPKTVWLRIRRSEKVDIDSVPPCLWLNFLKSKWPKNRKALETNHGDTETQRGRRTGSRALLGPPRTLIYFDLPRSGWIGLDWARLAGIWGERRDTNFTIITNSHTHRRTPHLPVHPPSSPRESRCAMMICSKNPLHPLHG